MSFCETPSPKQPSSTSSSLSPPPPPPAKRKRLAIDDFGVLPSFLPCSRSVLRSGNNHSRHTQKPTDLRPTKSPHTYHMNIRKRQPIHADTPSGRPTVPSHIWKNLPPPPLCAIIPDEVKHESFTRPMPVQIQKTEEELPQTKNFIAKSA